MDREKKEEEDVTSFFTKIITFQPFVSPGLTNFSFQITHGDAAFQDHTLHAIQNFLYFNSFISKKWTLVTPDKKLVMSLHLLLFFLTWPETLLRLLIKKKYI